MRRAEQQSLSGTCAIAWCRRPRQHCCVYNVDVVIAAVTAGCLCSTPLLVHCIVLRVAAPLRGAAREAAGASAPRRAVETGRGRQQRGPGHAVDRPGRDDHHVGATHTHRVRSLSASAFTFKFCSGSSARADATDRHLRVGVRAAGDGDGDPHRLAHKTRFACSLLIWKELSSPLLSSLSRARTCGAPTTQPLISSITSFTCALCTASRRAARRCAARLDHRLVRDDSRNQCPAVLVYCARRWNQRNRCVERVVASHHVTSSRV